jgi:site-specific recombinase XerD
VTFLADQGDTTDLASVQQQHVERFIAHQLATRKPATAGIRFRSLQQLFKWMADEGEIAQSPMARMRPPKTAEQRVPVLREDDLRRLLKTCESAIEFEGRCNTAMLRTFMDTGARLSEIAGLHYDPAHPAASDVDLNDGQLRVMGKGGRGSRALRALPWAYRE